jgi:predicted DNA-binding transcriptional regulator AlpA
MTSSPKKLLPARAVATRYGMCLKSIDRWLAGKLLPEPVRIRGRRYWYEDDLEKLERANIGSRLSATTDTTNNEPPARPDG